MEQLTLQEALTKYEKNTKQQLERYLTSQKYNFTVEGKGKNAIFTINGKQINQWKLHLGFEPTYKEATIKLLQEIAHGPLRMSDRALALQFGLGESSVKNARLDLVRHGFVVETKEQRRRYKEEGADTLQHRVNGSDVSKEEAGQYWGEIGERTHTILNEGDGFLQDIKLASSAALNQQREEIGQYACVVVKELVKPLTEEQLKFIKSVSCS